MFELKEQTTNDIKHLKVTNTNTQEYMSIISEFGAVVNELVLTKSDQNYSIINGCSSYSELIANEMYKSAKLIPFPNRIKDGKYNYSGKNYQLHINHPAENHALHGFIYDKEFVVNDVAINEDSAIIELEYFYNGFIPGYPFKFSTNITYALTREIGFKCTTKVRNIDDRPLPFGDGWHPYFKFEKKVDELMLKIPSTQKVEVDNRMIPTGEVIPFEQFQQPEKIGDTNFDTGFILNQDKRSATTEIYDPEQDVKIVIIQETGERKYNFLQVYIPPSRDSIAIEPMTCNTNALNNKDGLIILEPNEEFYASYGVFLE